MKEFGTYKELVAYCRTKLGEWGQPDKDKNPELDLVQLKYDGWWVACLIEGNEIKIITSGADNRQTWNIDNPTNVKALVIAEWMYGTNWSQSNNPGFLIVHDVLYWQEKVTDMRKEIEYDGSSDVYSYRLDFLESRQHRMFEMTNGKMALVQTFNRSLLKVVWETYTGFEGVVLKSSSSGFGCNMEGIKIKHEFTEDYVVMEIQEGGGRLLGKMGAIVGGQYVDGILKPICTVGGGFSDEMRIQIWERQSHYVGKVFEAYGKGKFPSGALRHPNFRNWREDKLPENCKLST